MKKRYMVSVAASLVAGGVGGLIAPFNAEGRTTYRFQLYVNPSGSGTMTCGWHTDDPGCITYNPTPTSPPGSALDWNGATSVTWRSYGYCSQSCDTIATGTTTGDVGSSCTDFHADLTATNPVQNLGYIHYAHATATKSTFKSLGTVGDYKFWSDVIGQTLSSEKSGCNWGGPHLHQDVHNGTWSLNTSMYTDMGNDANCQDDVCNPTPYPVADRSYYQMMTSWSYSVK